MTKETPETLDCFDFIREPLHQYIQRMKGTELVEHFSCEGDRFMWEFRPMTEEDRREFAGG